VHFLFSFAKAKPCLLHYLLPSRSAASEEGGPQEALTKVRADGRGG
jgi:hypothetical protein